MVAKKKNKTPAKKAEKRTEINALLRKIGLLGIGIAAITKEKADAMVKELVKDGDLNKEDGKKLVNELLEKSKKGSKELETKVSRQVNDIMKKANVASKKEIKILEAKIKELEKEVKKKTKK